MDAGSSDEAPRHPPSLRALARSVFSARETAPVGDANGRPARPARLDQPGWRGCGPKVWATLTLIRPQQWSKNGLVALALFYSGAFTTPGAPLRVGLAFAAFCLLSSVVYILNDLMDRRADALHPRKRLRPLASGALTPRFALALAATLLVGAVALCGAVARALPPFAAGASGVLDPYQAWGGGGLLTAGALAVYLLINGAYSLWLKRLPLYDVLAVASGFTLRALVGAFVIPVAVSSWFFLCVTFLALLLALGKRRAEALALGAQAGEHRPALRAYPPALLDHLLTMTASCALVTYSLYTFQGVHAARLLILTIPLALFGVMRYLYLVYVHAEGERPEALLWRDRQLRGCVALYLLAALVILYLLPA